MEYGGYEINPQNVTAADINAAVAELDKLPLPAVVHCMMGGRAAMIALVHEAKHENKDADSVLAKAKDLGLDFNEDWQKAIKEALQK